MCLDVYHPIRLAWRTHIMRVFVLENRNKPPTHHRSHHHRHRLPEVHWSLSHIGLGGSRMSSYAHFRTEYYYISVFSSLWWGALFFIRWVVFMNWEPRVWENCLLHLQFFFFRYIFRWEAKNLFFSSDKCLCSRAFLFIKVQYNMYTWNHDI